MRFKNHIKHNKIKQNTSISNKYKQHETLLNKWMHRKKYLCKFWYHWWSNLWHWIHYLPKISQTGVLVVLRFNATLTAKVKAWQSVTHMCFLAFSHQYYHNFLSKATNYFSHNASAEVRGENMPDAKLGAESVAYMTWKQVIVFIPTLVNFSPRIDGSYCDRIHSSLTADYFRDGFIRLVKTIEWRTGKRNSRARIHCLANQKLCYIQI